MWKSLFTALEVMVVAYTLIYLAFHVMLLLAGFRNVRRRVRGLGFEDLDLMSNESGSLPTVAVVVPAYNEAAVLVEAVRALTELDYPSLEIVIVNDGSTDETKDVMRSAFRMRRRDVPLRHDLDTAEVRAIYEATVDLPASVKRLVLVDKENGGKADSLNSGLNVSISPYFISIDADSILDPLALKQIIRVFQEQPDTIAAGGQVGIVNDCTVQDGLIVRRAVPSGYLPLCQTVEYVRSFSVARTGFSNLNALIILSGAFMVMTRDAAIQVGGFLTGRSESKLLEEYVGPGRSTICEDMEIIVRLHRYAKEMGRPARVVHTPMPVCWTELPEDVSSLSKQRRRWHRGLIEILRYNACMLLNPDYGRVGLLAMPYFVYFELVGPYIELLGWLLLPLLAALDLIDPARAALILSIALGAGVFQSILAVMAATWMEPVSPAGHHMRSMLGTDSWRDRLLLVAGCFLSELGYRQMTLFWRLQATWDSLAGRKGWDKFERRGFKRAAGTAAALALLFATTPARGEDRTVQVHVGQDAQHDGIHGWWSDAFVQWRTDRFSVQSGFYRVEREREGDLGWMFGGARRWRRGGFGFEARLAPRADNSASSQVTASAEVAAGHGFSPALAVARSQFEESTVWTLSPGVVYYHGNGWVDVRAHWWGTTFDANDRFDAVGGWSTRVAFPWAGRELRFSASQGGESYALGGDRDPGQVKALSAGLEWREPLGPEWTAILGVVHRRPTQGNSNVYVQTGVIRRW